jgi:hypothetical protein
MGRGDGEGEGEGTARKFQTWRLLVRAEKGSFNATFTYSFSPFYFLFHFTGSN